ncbi:MAG TPA: LysR family transcriptional regulator [Ktedonobacteraceae bacterium]
MDSKLDLRRLYYFVVVAEELHFTRAAERLHIAQPPLSYHIQQLEHELDVQLFERTRHHVQLTDAGRTLLSEAYRLFGQVEQMIRMVQRVGHGEMGMLTLGFVPSASNMILPTILRIFRERFPEVRLLLKEQNPDQLIRGLEEQHLDVGFLYLPCESQTLETRAVSREPLLAVLPEHHRLAEQTEIALSDLAEEFFVLPPRYAAVPGLLSHIMEACLRAGFVPRLAQEAWLMQTIIGLVAANIGVALVPASVQHLHRTGVVYKPLRDPSIHVAMGMLWQRGATLPTLQLFLRLVDEIAQSETMNAS